MRARFKRSALSLEQIRLDGPPVRLGDLQALSGLSRKKILDQIAGRHLHAHRLDGPPNTHWFVQRAEARRWLAKLGCDVFHETQNAPSTHQ